MTTAPCLYYGKLTQTESGPTIQPRAEYRVLTRSDGFPEDVVGVTQPATGLGPGSANAWRALDEPEAMGVFPVVTRHGLVRLGLRMRLEREQPDGGRLYWRGLYLAASPQASHQAVEAALSLEPWRYWSRPGVSVEPVALVEPHPTPPGPSGLDLDDFALSAVLYVVSGYGIRIDGALSRDQLFFLADAVAKLLPPSHRALVSVAHGFARDGSVPVIGLGRTDDPLVAHFDLASATWSPPGRRWSAMGRAELEGDALLPGKAYFSAVLKEGRALGLDAAELVAPVALDLRTTPRGSLLQARQAGAPLSEDPTNALAHLRRLGLACIDHLRLTPLRRWLNEGDDTQPLPPTDHIYEPEATAPLIREAAAATVRRDRRRRGDEVLFQLVQRLARVPELGEGPGVARARFIVELTQGRDPGLVLRRALEDQLEPDMAPVVRKALWRVLREDVSRPDAAERHFHWLLQSPTPPVYAAWAAENWVLLLRLGVDEDLGQREQIAHRLATFEGPEPTILRMFEGAAPPSSAPADPLPRGLQRLWELLWKRKGGRTPLETRRLLAWALWAGWTLPQPYAALLGEGRGHDLARDEVDLLVGQLDTNALPPVLEAAAVEAAMVFHLRAPRTRPKSLSLVHRFPRAVQAFFTEDLQPVDATVSKALVSVASRLRLSQVSVLVLAHQLDHHLLAAEQMPYATRLLLRWASRCSPPLEAGSTGVNDHRAEGLAIAAQVMWSRWWEGHWTAARAEEAQKLLHRTGHRFPPQLVATLWDGAEHPLQLWLLATIARLDPGLEVRPRHRELAMAARNRLMAQREAIHGLEQLVPEVFDEPFSVPWTPDAWRDRYAHGTYWAVFRGVPNSKEGDLVPTLLALGGKDWRAWRRLARRYVEGHVGGDAPEDRVRKLVRRCAFRDAGLSRPMAEAFARQVAQVDNGMLGRLNSKTSGFRLEPRNDPDRPLRLHNRVFLVDGDFLDYLRGIDGRRHEPRASRDSHLLA